VGDVSVQIKHSGGERGGAGGEGGGGVIGDGKDNVVSSEECGDSRMCLFLLHLPPTPIVTFS